MTFIGARLRTARELSGLTQDELARLAGMPRTDISKAENDKLSIGEARLARLADALEVSVLELQPEAHPDALGLSLSARLASVEDEQEKARRRSERALRAVTLRLAAVEEALALLGPRQARPRKGSSAR